MLFMHLSLIILIDFADLSLGMAILHGFTFNPAWIRPKKGATQMIFYDGHCGLCHRLVRFVLAEDRPGDTFHFAPLHGAVFRDAVPGPVAATLSDSVVVRTADGILLQRSAAVVDILKRLGRIWRILGVLLWLCPPLLRDWLYDSLTSNRHR